MTRSQVLEECQLMFVNSFASAALEPVDSRFRHFIFVGVLCQFTTSRAHAGMYAVSSSFQSPIHSMNTTRFPSAISPELSAMSTRSPRCRWSHHHHTVNQRHEPGLTFREDCFNSVSRAGDDVVYQRCKRFAVRRPIIFTTMCALPRPACDCNSDCNSDRNSAVLFNNFAAQELYNLTSFGHIRTILA